MKKIIVSVKFYNIIILKFVMISCFSCQQGKKEIYSQNIQEASTYIENRWSYEKVKEWEKNLSWLRGANFNPSTSINQLEFWQSETFDPETIKRELGWAHEIGFNTMRVYLHHVAWEVDKVGFKKRLNTYLSIAAGYEISTIFVFFDDCWNANYTAGKQPDPKPGIHNSGWVMDPGDLIFKTDSLLPILEEYVKDILETFKNDKRIILWDLYNEPGNNGRENKSLPLLKSIFNWARYINPSQPLTAGIWNVNLKELNEFQIENSDIITYHNYQNEVEHQKAIDSLKKINRPMICTEYMARKFNSLFSNIMPLLKKNKIGAINWGLVSGKSNTKYAWGEPIKDGSDPELWFHDIFKKDGTPYRQKELEIIMKLTNKSSIN